MKSKKQLLIEISGVLDTKAIFTTKTVMGIPAEELERILGELKDWEKPDDFEPKGEGPAWHNCPSELATGYRKKLSEYIKLNTGIYIPAVSTTSSRFYNLIAMRLGLDD